MRGLRSTPIPPTTPTATPAGEDDGVGEVEDDARSSSGRIYRVIGEADVSEVFILDGGTHEIDITCNGRASAVFLTPEPAPGEDVSVLEPPVDGEDPQFQFWGGAVVRIPERARAVLVPEPIRWGRFGGAPAAAWRSIRGPVPPPVSAVAGVLPSRTGAPGPTDGPVDPPSVAG
jgi:hypothetical protein